MPLQPNVFETLAWKNYQFNKDLDDNNTLYEVLDMGQKKAFLSKYISLQTTLQLFKSVSFSIYINSRFIFTFTLLLKHIIYRQQLFKSKAPCSCELTLTVCLCDDYLVLVIFVNPMCVFVRCQSGPLL